MPLGNTRLTLTEARDSVVYDATMETTLAGFEESVFLNIPATRSTEEAFEGSASAKLGPERIVHPNTCHTKNINLQSIKAGFLPAFIFPSTCRFHYGPKRKDK